MINFIIMQSDKSKLEVSIAQKKRVDSIEKEELVFIFSTQWLS